jgi:hypothetical protein
MRVALLWTGGLGLDSDLPLPSKPWSHAGSLLSARLASLEPAGMKAPWTARLCGKLLALAALSAFGCGLALAHADFLFAAIFAAASAAVIVEALRRLR